MKLDSNPNNQSILNRNGKIVRHGGISYRIHASKLGNDILAEVEPFTGNTGRINLFARTKVAKEIRRLVEMGIVS